MSKKFRYVGKEAQNLAQVGLVEPNQVITVDDKLAAGLEVHDPENYQPYVEPEEKAEEKAEKTEKKKPVAPPPPAA